MDQSIGCFGRSQSVGMVVVCLVGMVVVCLVVLVPVQYLSLCTSNCDKLLITKGETQ